jgi:hypothetical protein
MEMASTAEEALQTGSIAAKVAVEDLKRRVTELFKKNKHGSGPRMSPIEEACFWPAIQHAYIQLPKISSPKSWAARVSKVKISLSSASRPPRTGHESI